MIIERGFRDKIGKYLNASEDFTVSLATQGNAVYDTCCFGVDAADKISDDRYTVFYNQPASPENAVVFQNANGTGNYTVNLSRLPDAVAKLVFTVSIENNGRMGDIQNHSVKIIQNNNTALELNLTGTSFTNEKAVIDLEIYRKDEWRISAVARGFDGGLDALVKNYGGEIKEEAANTPAPAVSPAPVPAPAQSAPAPAPVSDAESQLTNRVMSRISLSKDKINLEKHVISLSKSVISLEKKSGVSLGNLRARVAVAIDYSGSMSRLYNDGTVQRTLNRLVPLGLTFDDNGSIDLYLFQSDCMRFPELSLSNYERYVNDIIKTSNYRMGGTNYAPVLEAMIYGEVRSTGFFGLRTERVDGLVDSTMPTFILFITDGANADRGATDCILRKSSGENVFIQFIGIGNESFSYLRKLDDLSGRVRDNTGFTQMSELDGVDDSRLYTVVLEEFANWLKNLQ